MYPASNSDGYPLPHPSCSFPFLGLNGNQILLHHYQDQFSTHYLAKNTLLRDTANINNVSLSANNIINCPNKNHYDSLRSFRSKKKPKGKERSCKILTSQGPRDRRVRLSIGIARKFFDLQEMLGFDKPSKTIGWLFKNSKLAMEELTHWSTGQDHLPKIAGALESSCHETTKDGASPTSECEDLAIETNEGSENKPKRAKEKKVLKIEAKDQVLARESRDKARARARERTIKKMWDRIETSQRLTSQNTSNFFGKKDIREMEEQFCKNELRANEGPKKEIIQESRVTKIKNNPSLILGFHPNLCAPIESPATYYGATSFNTENWGISRNLIRSSPSSAMTTITSSTQGFQGR